MIKRTIALTLAFAMMGVFLTGCVGDNNDNGVNPIDSLSIKRGINISSLEYDGMQKDIRMSLRDPYKEETFANIKNKGFDHVRLPVNFAVHYSDGKVSEEFLAQVDSIIDMMLEQGLTVILDFHGWKEINSEVKENKKKFYNIWEQVSEHYKDYPDTLLFEIINEPHIEAGHDPLDETNLNKIQLKAIKIIRKTNPKRILVVSGPKWNSTGGLELLELPENDPNIIVDVHTYQPMDFTHQGTEVWANPEAELEQVRISDDVYSEVDKVVKECKEFTQRTGIKTWVGEFGMVVAVPKNGSYMDLNSGNVDLEPLADKEDINKYVSYVTEKLEEANIPWSWWEYDLEFGAFDISKNEWRDFVIDGLIPQE